MTPIEELERFLTLNGESLEVVGLKEVALARESALLAISLIQKASVPILGGDVYIRNGSRVVPAYANWHCDLEPNERLEEYLARSYSVAINYVKNFPNVPRVVPLFVLVVGACSSPPNRFEPSQSDR